MVPMVVTQPGYESMSSVVGGRRRRSGLWSRRWVRPGRPALV